MGIKTKREREIDKKISTPLGRNELACLMIPYIRARFEDGNPSRQALFLKRINKSFSKTITWKLMKKHFNIDRNKIRREYENMGWKGWWQK